MKKSANIPDLKYEFRPIGYLQSLYSQRFGIPHQAGVSKGLTGKIVLNRDPDLITALRGLDSFSHIWVIFVFHSHGGKKWKPSIRPPRLGGNVKIGLLASRSPHRPNPIGISAVKLEKIILDAPLGPTLIVEDVDLLDGTPVLDIKPYIPLADRIESANSGWADIPVIKYPVEISLDAEKDFVNFDPEGFLDLKNKALAVIELDPRPAFQKRKIPVSIEHSGKTFGIDVLKYDIKYKITPLGFQITKVMPSSKKT